MQNISLEVTGGGEGEDLMQVAVGHRSVRFGSFLGSDKFLSCDKLGARDGSIGLNTLLMLSAWTEEERKRQRSRLG